MKAFELIILIWMIPVIFHAQESQQSINQIIAEIFEQYSEETGEEPDFESFQEDLLQLSESPVNLNSASREELDKIPFLSDQQIENLMYYIYKTGGMSNLFELQLVEGFDMTDIRRMLPFIRLENIKNEGEFPQLYEIFRYGKNEVYARFDHHIEKRKGFLSTDNAEPEYTGVDFYHYLKYKFHYRNRVQFSIVAENDAGENFFQKGSKGYDFYSASLHCFFLTELFICIDRNNIFVG